jgi:hypothetical protein
MKLVAAQAMRVINVWTVPVLHDGIAEISLLLLLHGESAEALEAFELLLSVLQHQL